MGLFTIKKEVKLENFCENFYENNILSGIFKGVDVGKYKEFIAQVFPEFLNIDPVKLKEEFTVLRFELFALAWQHSFNEDTSVEQSIFTFDFLQKNNKENIWNKMQNYNDVIAYSVKARHLNTHSGTMGNHFLDVNRMNLFDKYSHRYRNAGNYDNAITRVGNRISSKGEWKNGRGMIPYYLSLGLLRMLGYTKDKIAKITDNQQVSSHLMTIIKNFYDEIKKSLENIKIIN